MGGGAVIQEKCINQYVFAGRLDQSKGIRVLLEAWTILKSLGNDSKLIVCGNGPEEQWCKEFIRNNQLDNVEMKGFVSNEEVHKYIATSSALILPSQCYETFGMVILEALSLGVPVLCSDIGAPSIIIENGINGLKFKSGSAKAIVGSIINFNSYKFNRKIIKKTFIDKYTSEMNYKLLYNIYYHLN